MNAAEGAQVMFICAALCFTCDGLVLFKTHSNDLMGVLGQGLNDCSDYIPHSQDLSVFTSIMGRSYFSL